MKTIMKATGGGFLALTLLGIASLAEPGLAQSEPLPVVDDDMPPLQAQTPTAESWFGFTGASGRLRGAGDAMDDLVLGAPNENDGSLANVGGAYVFEDTFLQAPIDKPHRLDPVPPTNAEMKLGFMAIVIENLRGDHPVTGEPMNALILVGCVGRDVTYAGCGDPVSGAGSVEMYDFGVPGFAVPAKSLVAPLNPTDPKCNGNPNIGLSCPDNIPVEVQDFGNGMVAADVTRDGIPDLIVGAPHTDTEVARDKKGRIYVFKGHGKGVQPPSGPWDSEDFFDNPYDAWVGINAPDPGGLAMNWGSQFGFQIAAVNLDGDIAHEIVVGRPDKIHAATACAVTPCAAPQGGSAYVFNGYWLHNLFDGFAYDPTTNPAGTWQRVLCPPAPADVSSTDPEYQVLRNPFGDLQQTGPDPGAPLWNDAFGWTVFAVGDVGGPVTAEGGPIADIAIHAEATDFVGSTMDVNNPEVPDVGAVYVYYGVGPISATAFVDENHVLLQRPLNLPPPMRTSRPGRALARIDAWKNQLTGELEPGLLIAEPNAEWGGLTLAGIVYLLRLPLPAPSSPPYVPAAVFNAWGSTPLTEPPPVDTDEAGPEHVFGSWIVVLDYKDDQVDFPGQQFVVTARQADVRDQLGNVQPQAGRAWAFVVENPLP
jgi:hypothetical protein